MSWRINPKTGDYIQVNGAPVEDTSLIYPAFYRLKVKRSQWLYAPDARYGSDLHTVKKRFNPNDVNPLTDLCVRALAPMVDDGRALSTETTFLAPIGRNDVQMQTVITDAQGTPQTLNLPAIGGS